MLAQAFFEGIIAALGALVLELTIQTTFNLPPVESSLLTLFICVSIEEILKYTFILNNYQKSKCREQLVFRAVLIGLGFSLAELFLKQLRYQEAITLPVIGVLLIHITTAVLVAAFIGKDYNRNKFFVLFLITLNSCLHFFYNLLVLRYF